MFLNEDERKKIKVILDTIMEKAHKHYNNAKDTNEAPVEEQYWITQIIYEAQRNHTIYDEYTQVSDIYYTDDRSSDVGTQTEDPELQEEEKTTTVGTRIVITHADVRLAEPE